MMDETTELTNEANGATEQTERTPGERAAVAKRVALHRARKSALDARELVLSERQALKQRKETESLFARTVAKLTPAQKLALETETEDHLTLKHMNGMLFHTVALCDLEHFEHCRPDLAAEIYADFIKAFPYAKAITFPRAWYADTDFRKEEFGNHFFDIRSPDGEVLVEFDPEASQQFSLDRFFDAVKAYKKWRAKNSTTVEPAEKQQRGRTKKEAPPKEPVAANPSAIATWTTGPTRPQAEIWGDHEAALVAKEVQKDLEHAAPSKPVVFDGM